MTIDVDAVYEKGILTLKHPVDLPENAEVHVTIQTAAEARTPLGRRLRELRTRLSSVAIGRGVWRPRGSHRVRSSFLAVREEK